MSHLSARSLGFHAAAAAFARGRLLPPSVGATADPPRLRGLRAMETWWIIAFAGGGASILLVLQNFIRVCVLLGKTRWRRLPEDGIKFSLSSPHPGDASSIIGGHVEVCIRWICLWQICLDLVAVRLRLSGYRLSPFNLQYSSIVAVAVLLRWSYGVLARRLPDYLLQQVLLGSNEGGEMIAARPRLASAPVVVARWSSDLDVIFIISGVRCTAMVEDE